MAKKKAAVKKPSTAERLARVELLAARLSGYVDHPRISVYALETKLEETREQFNAYAESTNTDVEHLARRQESTSELLFKKRETVAGMERDIETIAARVSVVEKELRIGILDRPTLSERIDSQSAINGSIFDRLTALERPGFFRRLWRKVRRK